MLFVPCEICVKPVNETEAEQSLNFTKKVIGEEKVLCAFCRHDSNVLKSILKDISSY